MLSSNLTTVKPTIKPPINLPSTPPVKPPIKLLVTHDVLVTQSFLNVAAENSTYPSSSAAHQVDEVSTWLNTQGSGKP
jgi:hypothetical protein